MVFQQ